MQDSLKGLLALIAANVIWGLAPIFYKELSHVPPVELLCHRSLWSLVFFGAIVALQGRLGQVRTAFQGRLALPRVMIAATLISFNWGMFIWSIQVERAVEASLGYYIFPLISVLIGSLFFAEGWQRSKVIALALASGAVGVLTLGLGAAPWVALLLAISFACYGVLKRATPTGPVLSVTAEVTLLGPIVLAWLIWVHASGGGVFGGSVFDTALLMLSGPLTATPLILFSYASRRLGFGTIGLVQYLNPTLQFGVAVLIFAEPFTRWHAIALPLIWAALAIYSAGLLWSASRSAPTRASVCDTTVT